MITLTKPKRACRIGVLFSLDNETHRAYADMIRHIIGRDPQLRITYINTAFTQDAVRKKVFQSVNCPDPYDVFIAIGLRFSLFLKEVYRELGQGRAIFVGVRDLVRHKLVDSFESPGLNTTAVTMDAPTNTAVAEKLAPVSKYINRIIIPFLSLNDTDLQIQQVADVTNFFKSCGIAVEALALSSPDQELETEKFLKGTLQKHDVVLMREGASPSFYREASYLCYERDALLCADTPSAIYRGAAFAFGGELDGAVEALKETLETYWINELPLGNISVKTVPYQRVFIVNTMILRMVGFPEEAIKLFQTGPDTLVMKMWVDCPINRSGD